MAAIVTIKMNTKVQGLIMAAEGAPSTHYQPAPTTATAHNGGASQLIVASVVNSICNTINLTAARCCVSQMELDQQQ